MQNAGRKEIMPGVFLTAVQTDKFKTCCLSLSMLRPIDEADAAKNALLPRLLRRGTKNHPDMESLSAAMDELYGASIEPVVRKKGEIQLLGFYADFIDDAFTPQGEKLLEPVCGLLGELLLEPYLPGGGFSQEYFDSERGNLIDEIEAQLNDKRSYAQHRLVELMCSGESYGVDRLGSVESANKLTCSEMLEHYRKVISTSQTEVFYCGSASTERVENALKTALGALAVSKTEPVGTVIVASAGEPRYFEDAMDVTQGKLCMGFRVGLSASDEEYPELTLFNAVFGGSVNSKLFMNVREKLSLCYYASSGIEKHKGVMIVSSGVEFKNYQVAKDEILAQLEACKKGEIDEQELEGARQYLISSLKSAGDSQARLEDFYLGQAIEELKYSPEELASEIAGVTPEQVVAAAKRARLDTVYFLKGLEVE